VESNFVDGAGNMARDSAIAEAVAAGTEPPTLRLYGWQPSCLSLGYGQRARSADLAALRVRGWDLLRRPTGGTAILHAEELTYSLSLPAGHPLVRTGIVESYRRISRGLLQALQILGLQAQAQQQAKSRAGAQPGAACFAQPGQYEIAVGGRKLIGSAQLRRRGFVLQHGSLPLRGDLARICDVLAYPSEDQRRQEKRRLRAHALTLEQTLARAIPWQEAARAFAQGFAAAFELDLQPGELSPAEIARADALRAQQFTRAEWTHKR